MPRPSHYKGMAHGGAALLLAFASALVPPPVKTISEWAEEKREVSAESGSSRPGRWSNEVAPELVEIMEELSPSSPAQEIIFKKSHQVGGTEIVINTFGFVVDEAPAPMLVVMATLEQSKDLVKLKVNPTIAETRELAAKVREQKSRDADSSTAAFKRFRGGFARFTGANSSKGLQMISVKYMVGDEISDWPLDVDGRGDPLVLAETRTTVWRHYGRKHFLLSTPSLKGICRISARYELSDQRRRYLPCPQCGHYQVLTWERFRVPVLVEGAKRHLHPKDAEGGEVLPGACFECAANGCVIEHHHKTPMRAAGVWIKCYPGEDAPPDSFPPERLEPYRARSSGGRTPGFALWQAYSAWVTWDDIAASFFDSLGDPRKEKVFAQQVLGEDFEESGEAPDWELLYKRREDFPLGRIPLGGLVLTGFTDVQGNRLEYGVYAWGIGLRDGWLIDKGVLEGYPNEDEVWRRHDEVLARRYRDSQGREWPVEAWGVDTGFLSNAVYRYCRGRERVLACDGRGDHLHPYVGTPKRVDVSWRGKRIAGGCMLWPTGTWQLKSWIYGKLRQTIEGPDEDGRWPHGCLHYPAACDEAYLQQLTAEYLKEVERRDGRVDRMWVKASGQANEALDIAVGARAMAYHLQLDFLSADRWQALAAERGTPEEASQPDLFALRLGEAAARQASKQNTDTAAVDRARRLARMNG